MGSSSSIVMAFFIAGVLSIVAHNIVLGPIELIGAKKTVKHTSLDSNHLMVEHKLAALTR